MSKTKSTSTNIDKTVKEITSSLKDLEKKQEELKKEMQAVGKTAISSIKDLINLSPYIEAIRWNQYTPYFNDGDACEFGVNGVEIKLTHEVTGKAEISEDDESEFIDFGKYGEDPKEFLEKRKDVLNFKSIDELETVMSTICDIHERLSNMGDVLKDTFGDHVEVKVTREGIETDSYDHD